MAVLTIGRAGEISGAADKGGIVRAFHHNEWGAPDGDIDHYRGSGKHDIVKMTRAEFDRMRGLYRRDLDSDSDSDRDPEVSVVMRRSNSYRGPMIEIDWRHPESGQIHESTISFAAFRHVDYVGGGRPEMSGYRPEETPVIAPGALLVVQLALEGDQLMDEPAHFGLADPTYHEGVYAAVHPNMAAHQLDTAA